MGDESIAAGVVEAATGTLEITADACAEEENLALGGNLVVQENIAGDPDAVSGEGIATGVVEVATGTIEIAADACAEETNLAFGGKLVSQENIASNLDTVGAEVADGTTLERENSQFRILGNNLFGEVATEQYEFAFGLAIR